MAVAGSGKTTSLVQKAIDAADEKILFLTYTNENLTNIKNTFVKETGYVPENVEIKSWFSFLLRDGVRPYHNYLSAGERANSINFINGSSRSMAALRYIREANTEMFYFDRSRNIYTDKIAQYVCRCNEKSDGKVISRLEEIYDTVYIDEVQDLAAWDLEILIMLFESKLKVTFVGDPRQVTYSTNQGAKNNQFRDEKIINFFTDLERRGKCEVINSVNSRRCNQAICDWANSIYPDLEASVSANTEITNHDGIFRITSAEVPDYIETHHPVILRHNIKTDTLGYPARNFGVSKGSTFDRVLIFPTAPIKQFLETGNPDHAGDKAKLYVAVTRARYSVAFVTDS